MHELISDTNSRIIYARKRVSSGQQIEADEMRATTKRALSGQTYCYSTFLFHYYYYSYYSSTHFFHSISRRCLNEILWNLVGISYAMWSCSVKGWFFQNGYRCHGNDQNAKKLKNTKMIIAGYSPNRNWWNLIGTNFAAVAMETKKGWLKTFLDSFHQTSWNFVGISTVVRGSFWWVEKHLLSPFTR